MKAQEGEVIYKGDFIKQLMEKYGYSRNSATTLLDDVSNLIIENIEKGNTIFFSGFGKLTLLRRKGHKAFATFLGENGRELQIPDTYSVRFYPGAKLKYALRKWLASREQTEVGD